MPCSFTRAARAVLALVLTLGATTAAAQSAAPAGSPPAPTALATTIDSLADSLTAGPIVGMAVVVARGPDILLARGYGLADRDAGRPATAGTVYQIGSVTKQFTAAAVMRLVEQGRVSLDEPITTYLADFPMQGNIVTVRHLLSHTSGIRSYTSFLPPTASMSVRQVYDAIIAQPFDFAPGTQFRYNNSGYLLLGMIIEQVTGRSYGEVVQDWFFGPLGMDSTRFCGAGGAAIPAGYRPGPGAVTQVPPVDMRVPFAAGALCSTAPDLARWAWALATGKVVTPASYALMTGGTTLASGRRLGYGFGLAADTAGGRAMVFHGGGIPGFASNLVLFPEDGTIVVVLLNTEGNMGPVSQRIVRAALAALRP